MPTNGISFENRFRIIDYRPVPVSLLALEPFSIRRFFRDLTDTHIITTICHLEIVNLAAVLDSCFSERGINYITPSPSESEAGYSLFARDD